MAVPSPVGDVKIVSPISTFMLNTLTLKKKKVRYVLMLMSARFHIDIYVSVVMPILMPLVKTRLSPQIHTGLVFTGDTNTSACISVACEQPLSGVALTPKSAGSQACIRNTDSRK